MPKKPDVKSEDKPTIKVTPNGPYMVSGVPKITEQFIMPDEEGASATYRTAQNYSKSDPVALCRCGHSSTPPYCDGHHTAAGFIGTCSASHTPIKDAAISFEGDKFTLLDNDHYCAFSRFCDALGRIWDRMLEQTAEGDRVAISLAHACPAGRLMIIDKETGKQIEPKFEPEIAVLEDPAIGVSGPLYAKGGIIVEDENGRPYECRNRQTLCRCGHSANKPFCDGAHASARFDDGQIVPRKTKA